LDLAGIGGQWCETPVSLEMSERALLQANRQEFRPAFRITRDELETRAVIVDGDSRADDVLIARQHRCLGAPWQECRIVLGSLDQVENALGRKRNENGPASFMHAARSRAVTI